MKRAFMMVDILVAIVLLSILLLGSVKAIGYMNNADQTNELRYLALNKLDSEMSRLVMTYENKDPITAIVELSSGTNSYKSNPISVPYGLKVIADAKDLVEIKNTNGVFNTVDANDIVGYLSWNEDKNTKDVNISLNIEYPYRYKSDDTLERVWDFTESVNLQTSTKIR